MRAVNRFRAWLTARRETRGIDWDRITECGASPLFAHVIDGQTPERGGIVTCKNCGQTVEFYLDEAGELKWRAT